MKNCDVVIVLAAIHIEDSGEAVPLGAACIAAALKESFPAARVSIAEAYIDDADCARLLARRIAEALPGDGAAAAAGFSMYSWNRRAAVDAARMLREQFPGIFLFCGGPEVTALPGGLSVNDGGPFDACVSGEGERKAVTLIGGRFFPDVELPRCDGDDSLDTLPSPWLTGTLRPRSGRGVLWELSRGCPYACAYCYESKGDRRLRHIDGERLVRELELFIESGVPYVFVLDPTFNADDGRALRILDHIIAAEKAAADKRAQRLPRRWHFEVRAELVTRAQAKRFARLGGAAGVSLQVGLQTSSPEVSRMAGRPFDVKAFRRGIDVLNKESAVFGVDLIYGLPGDSLAGYKKSLDFALGLYPNNLDMFRLSLLPGTALFDQAAALGMKAEQAAPYRLASTKTFSAADLDKAETLSRWADVFYNQGRAVGWFMAALAPLGKKPSIFIEEFAAYCAGRRLTVEQAAAYDSHQTEALQLAFLEAACRRAKQPALFGELREAVREHWRYSRALAGE